MDAEVRDRYLAPPEMHRCAGFVIRGVRENDGAIYTEAIRDSYEHLKRYMTWAKADHSAADSEHYVRTSRGHWLLCRDFPLAIVSEDGSRLLGGTGFHLRGKPLAQSVAEIGMWIRASEAGKGLGTRVLRELLAWGFSAWPWERLCWTCDAANTASAGVAKGAGMTFEGTLYSERLTHHGERRDTLLFAATRGRWHAPKP